MRLSRVDTHEIWVITNNDAIGRARVVCVETEKRRFVFATPLINPPIEMHRYGMIHGCENKGALRDRVMLAAPFSSAQR